MPARPWDAAAVAWVNPPEQVGVTAPTPTASVGVGGVELRWPAPADAADGCHLYRRAGERETRLTETPLRFEVAAAGRVRLAVFDAAVRLVAVAEDGIREAGRHRVVWRGRDGTGRPLPSGAYYVRLETASRTDTRKVMLLK